MSWCYGLIEIGGQLVLAEVYFDKKGKPNNMWCEVTWKELEKMEHEPDQDIDETIKMIADDISSQIKTKNFFYLKKDKIVYGRPKKKGY